MRSFRDRNGGAPAPASSSAEGSGLRLQPARRDLLLGFASGAVGLGLGSDARAATAGMLPAGDDGTQDFSPSTAPASRA